MGMWGTEIGSMRMQVLRLRQTRVASGPLTCWTRADGTIHSHAKVNSAARQKWLPPTLGRAASTSLLSSASPLPGLCSPGARGLQTPFPNTGATAARPALPMGQPVRTWRKDRLPASSLHQWPLGPCPHTTQVAPCQRTRTLEALPAPFSLQHPGSQCLVLNSLCWFS